MNRRWYTEEGEDLERGGMELSTGRGGMLITMWITYQKC